MDKFIWDSADIRVLHRAKSAPLNVGTEDLSAWRRKAIKSVKAGRSAAVRFESDAIPDGTQTRIRTALKAAQSVADVVAAFEVKAEADPLDALIDDELTEALAWAQKASE